MPKNKRFKESRSNRSLRAVSEENRVSPEDPSDLFREGPEPAALFDAECRPLWINKAAVGAGAAPPDSDSSPSTFLPFWSTSAERDLFAAGALGSEGISNSEVRIAAEGTVPARVYWVSGWPSGSSRQFVAVARDVTARVEKTDALAASLETFVANPKHQTSSSVFTREPFRILVEREVETAAKEGLTLALLVINIDDFQSVNDMHGIASGDDYLFRLCDNLKSPEWEGAVLGRIGGGDIAVLIPGLSMERAVKEGERILSLIALTPYDSEGHSFTLTACAGLALFPDHGRTGLDLVKAASGALRQARNRGRARLKIHDPSDREPQRLAKLQTQAARIREDLQQNRFVPFFQPIAEVSSGRIVAVETLARRCEENGEVTSPAEFLDAAERFGFVTEIDKMVIARAFDAFAAGRGRIAADLEMSLNLSGIDFDDDRLVADISRMARNKGIRPDRVTFEITETAVIRDLSRVQNFMEALKAEGFRFALDDFGIGFSSFQYLRELPVSCLKFDVSYVQNLPTQLENRVFVRGMAEICRGLGVKTVAEGVESATVLSILKELGVDRAQGYHIGRPSPKLPAR